MYRVWKCVIHEGWTDYDFSDFDEAEEVYNQFLAEKSFNGDILNVLFTKDLSYFDFNGGTSLDWEEKIKILRENDFLYIGDRYIHIPTKKEFWVADIKKLNDWNFNKLIECKCIYEDI